MSLKFLLPLAAVASLASCDFRTEPAGPEQHTTRTVELDKSEMLRVDLKMGAGELRVEGGSAKLATADFTYNVPSLMPDFRYTNTGVRGELVIEEPGHNQTHVANKKNRWDVQFNNDVPLDLAVHFGAGEANLALAALSLRSVDVEMGVGQLTMDLRGHPKRDYDVHVHGGVGEATIYLPRDVGVYADATGGIGGISARGLRQENGHYVNDQYNSAKVKIHLDVHGGIGAINLVGE
jgi:hypothetical protein